MTGPRFDPTSRFSAAEMAQLRARSDVRGIFCVVHAWAVIGASMALFALWPSPLTFIIAVVLIGSRQLGLAILMHDAAHGVLVDSRRLNDPLSQWLCAFPVFADTIPYRHYHLVHHRRTQQADDPDLHLSAKFPITRASFRRKLIRDITGQTGYKQRRAQIRAALGKPGDGFAARLATFRRKLGGPLLANLVLLALLTAFGKPHYYLMFWLLPLLTWQQVVTRIRNIAEHAMVPDNDDPMRNARTTYANWWERALFAPYWVNYHVDHHLLFYVPCYNLPKLHAMLLEKGLGPKMEIKQTYAEVLRLAASKPERAAQAA
ncbi:MAG: fatty acid desaturase family protein [Alphaproteobacteria bacterium]|nr:fatty acid desaturase family protein [Alphaproteobacteria bacterium]